MESKTFSIDLCALNKYLGEYSTSWGYHIEIEQCESCSNANDEDCYCDSCFFDLRGVAGLYACDGEVCEVVCEYEHDVVVRNTEYDLCGEFKFSKEEFAIIFNP